jgi:hypothetical protein
MLLTATATVALLGMAAPGAFAFDKVEWSWEKHVREWVDIDIDIKTDVYPDGLVEVEKLQVHFGDVNAYAGVHNIYNNLPDDPRMTSLDSEFWIPPPPTYDNDPKAVDLPKIENTATAVGNNQSITSNVPIYLHDGQFVAGDLGFDCASDWERCRYLLWEGGDYGNTHLDLAGLLFLGGVLGVVQKAEIKADAHVSNILNAYVENSATAVANNASFTIEPYATTPYTDNHVLIADLTQFSYANVTANARVERVALNGYEDLGGACFGGGCPDGELVPIISNTATAVGNNLSISVGVPTVE